MKKQGCDCLDVIRRRAKGIGNGFCLSAIGAWLFWSTLITPIDKHASLNILQSIGFINPIRIIAGSCFCYSMACDGVFDSDEKKAGELGWLGRQ